MAFFDEISKTLAGKSKEAAQKAKDVAEVLQLKTQISSEKGKVKELYASIGALYFKKHREDAEDEYQLFFPEIETTLAHIAELEAKVRELDGSRCCSSCGASVRKDDAFCSKCGAAVEKEEPAAKEAEETEEEADSVLLEVSETVEADEDIFEEESVTASEAGQ